MREIRFLSAAETRLAELRERLAEQGITAEIGHRLAGFADGEGCFLIGRQQGGFKCAFIIKLRADDRAVLERYAGLTGVGRLHATTPKATERCTAMPVVRWEVGRKAECLTLVDIFTAYPLWSKKQRDFLIWARAVEEWNLIQPYAPADWSLIAGAFEELRTVRAYPLSERVAADGAAE